ncbi:MAG: dipicolinate synthase subunit DpsA [Oscillospiraceae bacterium]|nr:dipicolinate synthase subunit DpsA [Oscillospiraceae bacterium]
MRRDYYFWLLGGDRRQVHLARLLREDGHQVQTYALEQALPCAETLEGISRADCVILPLPAAGAQGILNAPLSDHKLPLRGLMELLNPGQLLCGGKLGDDFARQCRERGLTAVDYFEREELAVRNAVPTAEGAIKIAMEELPTTLYDARVLVIGFGRIGKLLAHRLRGLGAQVTVSARSFADLAWIEAYGYKSEHTDELAGWLCSYDLIVNTVPAPVLGEAALEDVAPGCLILDLASAPGGVDFEAAAALGLKAIHALSLPGKAAPVTAGKILRDTIYHVLQEVDGDDA